MVLTQTQIDNANAAMTYHVQTLREMQYPEYLMTTHWHWVRYRKLAQARFKCERCYSTTLLQAHHLNYDRLGNERMSDLVVLCRGCHQQAHSTKED